MLDTADIVREAMLRQLTRRLIVGSRAYNRRRESIPATNAARPTLSLLASCAPSSLIDRCDLVVSGRQVRRRESRKGAYSAVGRVPSPTRRSHARWLGRNAGE